MQLSSYHDFIHAAKSQNEPQRLLFVFAKATMPDHATDDQKRRFEQGEGGNLEPVLCVDKLPDEVADFDVLIAESAETGKDWDIAFAASMSGLIGIPPTPEQAEQPLKMMVESIKSGNIANFLAFNRQGELLRIL
ncbi:ribonucleotide reductase subunit alpha [Aliidiomarina sanyensis]|uniref:Ribonucleotide reductase subunit alpha n=1 Tax=Aliidiomarina sanyensis TaxID=1249555 RepID=A0A432WRF2_9GAMM|nr:ribonucleotide reductase subunit alpha [Aliidiomarina sanyensis]RUO36386.1 ribonucleotide reductase subunit alpha [Aliidiomarina sanyensis]